MNTIPLPSFLRAQLDGERRKMVAYVWLRSGLWLHVIAHKLSQATGLRFLKAEGFDECDAFVAETDGHDITVLQLRDDAGKESVFEVMIEPGQDCELRGEPVNLSAALAAWLTEHAPGVGTICVME